MKKWFAILLVIFLCIANNLDAQQEYSAEVKQIQELLNQDSVDYAHEIVIERINFFTKKENYDSLANYVYLHGKIDVLKSAKEKGVESINSLATLIIENSDENLTLYKTYSGLGLFYSENGEMPLAYENIKKAREFSEILKSLDFELDTEYYLAEFSMKMGDFNLFERHIRKSVQMAENNSDKELQMTAKAFNLMGGLMFFSSEHDSALYYFDKALLNIKNLEQTPKNKYYLPAAIKGNLVMLKQNQGKFDEAIALEKESNRLNKEFLKRYKNHPLATNVKRNLSIGYLDLASLYGDLGDYDNAEKFSTLLYDFSKENFLPSSQEYFTAVLNVAETNLFKKDFLEAKEYLIEAQKCLKKVPGENLQLHAHLYGVFGNLYYKLGDYIKSKDNFLLSQQYYEKAHQGVYSRDRLYQLMNLSILLSIMNEKELAIELVNEAYTNYSKIHDIEDQLTVAIINTFSRVYFEVGEFEKSLEWSSKGLEKYKTKEGLKTTQDMALFDILKAKIIMLHANARYSLESNPDTEFIREIINEVNQAVAVFENRKSIISTISDVNASLEDNKEVLDFLKSLHVDLYKSTNDPKDLYKLISLQESGLYNRIRVRLNIHNKISFSGVPESTIKREKHLRKIINESVTSQENGEEVMETILGNNAQWISFLDSLRISNPKYHKMRYSSLEKPLDDIKNHIPENYTVIRYIYIGEELYAFVIDENGESLTSINSEDIIEQIEQINDEKNENKYRLYYNLYESLWAPIKDLVKTTNVIIIPDRTLFNLSFESLTSKAIDSPEEFLEYSLLTKHIISYNYSLFLLDQKKNGKPYDKNFIAFAPEFTDEMKSNYKYSITDSSEIDKTYLNLLPQPFNYELVKKSTNLFDGSSFLNEESTENIFKNTAKEHKIIHIGTHAESNNLSPELSRLLFAKNINDTTSREDNSLYTYEIYDCNLSCNLAILTACETGKPTYQAGEGMISLAHAFNYAGSESIITSLWKIDEQSSSKITEYFYENIKDGLKKDEALQKAKIKYLSSAQGRLQNPQYWAGLVLIGDTSPIDINTKSSINWIYIVLGGFLVIVIVYFFLAQKKRFD